MSVTSEAKVRPNNETEGRVGSLSTDCLLCGAREQDLILSLGQQPLANSLLDESALRRPEPVYPLDLYRCSVCGLVHINVVASSEDIFSDYVYFSSYSSTWLDHARDYTKMATARFQLGTRSQVIEVASNDGYLLQFFVEDGIPCLGIEPAANVAQAATEKGIPTEVCFWTAATAQGIVDRGVAADLLIANNVLAHVPTLNDFVAGLRIALQPGGVLTVEFPHLLRLLEHTQFDTIYHEHFCYYSLQAVQKLFSKHGLAIFDVEELHTHGGSLRVYAQRQDTGVQPESERVAQVLELEFEAGLQRWAPYQAFADRVARVKQEVLQFLTEARNAGKQVVAYGAPAKGNTLINYCHLSSSDIAFTVDRNPHKQGCWLPGSRIPVHPPDRLHEARPPFLFILPWNLTEEIVKQCSFIREWGGKFVTAIPSLRIID